MRTIMDKGETVILIVALLCMGFMGFAAGWVWAKNDYSVIGAKNTVLYYQTTNEFPSLDWLENHTYELRSEKEILETLRPLGENND